MCSGAKKWNWQVKFPGWLKGLHHVFWGRLSHLSVFLLVYTPFLSTFHSLLEQLLCFAFCETLLIPQNKWPVLWRYGAVSCYFIRDSLNPIVIPVLDHTLMVKQAPERRNRRQEESSLTVSSHTHTQRIDIHIGGLLCVLTQNQTDNQIYAHEQRCTYADTNAFSYPHMSNVSHDDSKTPPEMSLWVKERARERE